MKQLKIRITALLLAAVMMLTLCSCSYVSAKELSELYAGYSDSYDNLYERLCASYSDTVSDGDYIEGLGRLDSVLAGVDVSDTKASQRDILAGELERTYNQISLELLSTAMNDVLVGYHDFYFAAFEDASHIPSATDAVSAILNGASSVEEAKGLLCNLNDLYFGQISTDITADNKDALMIGAFRLSEQPDTIILVSNFAFPPLHDDSFAFALEFVSSNGLEFSQPDTLYNCDAISYISRNIVAIDMTKVITAGEMTDLFTAYKRISFILFSLDNSLTFEADLSALRSDDFMNLPQSSADALSRALGW